MSSRHATAPGTRPDRHYYQSKLGFTFPDAVIVAGNYIGTGLTWCYDAHLNSCRDTSHSKIEE